MAKTSFSNKKTIAADPAAEPVAPVAAEQLKSAAPAGEAQGPASAVAPAAAAQPPAVVPPRPFDDENIDASDITILRLNIAQKVGDLGNQFTPGSLVYDQSLPMIEAPLPNTVSKSIRFVVIGFQPKKFEEKVPFGTQGAQVFDTEEELVKFGGTLDFEEAKTKKIPLFQRSATALLLVEQPEGFDAAAFPHAIDGKNYTLALFKMKGSLYTNGAKTLFTARKIGHLKAGGYRSGFWTFATFLKKHMGGNASFIPVFKPAGVTSPALQQAVVELIGF